MISGLDVPRSIAANCATGARWAGSSCGWTMERTKSMFASFSWSAAISSTSASIPGATISCVGAEDDDAVGAGAVVDGAGGQVERRPGAAGRQGDAARRGRQRVVDQPRGDADARALHVGAGGSQPGEHRLVLDLDAGALEQLERRPVDGLAAFGIQGTRVESVLRHRCPPVARMAS